MMNRISVAFVVFIIYVIVLAIYLSALASINVYTVTSLMNATVVLAVASCGLTLISLLGEFDLSLIGVIALTNVVVATTSTVLPYGIFVSLLLCCLIGLAVGLVNGLLIVYGKMQSLAITIGTLIVCEGLALLVLSAPGGYVAPEISDVITAEAFDVIPVALIIMAGFAIFWLILKRTRFGMALYAVGTDRTTARLSGIKVERVRLFAFVLAGLLYGIAGYLLSAQIGSGDPRTSSEFLLLAFAAVAIGGTALTGGRGGMIGTLWGAGILAALQKMLFAVGVQSFYTSILGGIIMLVAVGIGVYGTKVRQAKQV